MGFTGTEWAAEDIETAAKMWADGKSASEIGRVVRRSREAVLGQMHRKRDLFPKRPQGVIRQRPPGRLFHRKAEVLADEPGDDVRVGDEALTYVQARINEIRAVVPRHSPAAKALMAADRQRPAKASTRQKPDTLPDRILPHGWARGENDFRLYVLPECQPVEFADLTRAQCHFPLSRVEDVSGKTMPCCGAAVLKGLSYCADHQRLSSDAWRRRAVRDEGEGRAARSQAKGGW